MFNPRAVKASNNSIHQKDFKMVVKGGLNSLISGIEVDHSELLPKKSEDFVQKVIKDTKGNLIKNEPVHNMMHRFIRLAKSKGFNKYMILGLFGHGKSLLKGTKVIMSDCSIKNIEDVVVGDFLMGVGGKPRKVLSLGRGKEQAYKVTLKNKDSFSCNESHKIPFQISNRWSGFNIGDEVIMTLGDYLNLPSGVRKNCLKIKKGTIDFKEVRVPMDPYVYGAWLGDGGNILHRKFQLTINDRDTVISDYFFTWGRKFKYRTVVYAEKGKCASYNLTNTKFSKMFFERYHKPLLTFVGGEKRISKVYLKNSVSIRMELLAGMLDTDGYMFDNCFEWSTKFIGLRDDFLFLCRSLGFRVSHRVKVVNGRDYYVVIVSGNTHTIPCKTRKKAGVRRQVKNPLVYGFSVEDIGEQDYYGITLDGDKLYLQDDFTIHHNTEQLCIGYALYKIAQNPNILIKMVHVSDTEAVKRCRSIRDYIERDDDFHALAPHISPTSIWGSERFIVTRTAPSKDGTVEAYSVLGTGIGGRANLIIFDDPQDLRTAVYEPTTREKIEDTIKNIWLTRLIPDDQEVVLMMNKWHEADLASYVQRNPTWAWMSVAVSEDLTHLKYEDRFGQKLRIPLWSKFGTDALQNRKTELGVRNFDRGYRLIAYTDKDKSFAHFEQCCHYGISPRAIVEKESNWLFIVGIDFASSKRPGTVVSLVAVHRKTGLKVPVEIIALTKASEIVAILVRLYRDYGVDLFMAENNGVQDAIIDLLQSALGVEKYKKYNIKIEGFLTGKNKADEVSGLPSMDKEFENKEWMFCFEGGKPEVGDNQESNVWSRMFFEMNSHPFYGTTDIVMSLWFAREGAKKLIRKSGGPQVW